MVGRRKESPKSFLGKQRAVVTPLIVGGQVGHNMPSRIDDTDHVLASTITITTKYAHRLACMSWFEQNRRMGIDGITRASHRVSFRCPVQPFLFVLSALSSRVLEGLVAMVQVLSDDLRGKTLHAGHVAVPCRTCRIRGAFRITNVSKRPPDDLEKATVTVYRTIDIAAAPGVVGRLEGIIARFISIQAAALQSHSHNVPQR